MSAVKNDKCIICAGNVNGELLEALEMYANPDNWDGSNWIGSWQDEPNKIAEQAIKSAEGE